MRDDFTAGTKELLADPVGRDRRFQCFDARFRVPRIPQRGRRQPCGLLHVGLCDRLSRLQSGGGSDRIHAI
jgi:hypothetical protein